MRKSLLLTLEFPPQKGGTQTYYFNICKNLPSDKIVVLMPSLVDLKSNPPSPPCQGGEVGFKIYRKNLLAKYLYPRWLPMVLHLRKIVKKEKIELIQVGQVLPCGAAAFLINKFFKIPYVVYTHGLDILGPQKNSRKKNLMIKILRNAEKVISNSEFTKNEVAKLGIDNSKIFVVYPGVNLVDQQNPPSPPCQGGDIGEVEELRKKYNLGDKKILLSVCRLVERKGIDLVISDLVKFKEELKDVVYVVVGDGPKMEDLKRLWTSHLETALNNPHPNPPQGEGERVPPPLEGVRGRVKEKILARSRGDSSMVASDHWQTPNRHPQIVFTGRVSDEELDLWYRICDVFILTPKKSDFDVEGFGIIYAEASSYSKPVIGSRLAGICEAVEDGVTGILVEPDNIEQIGKAIIKLFSDEDLRERLGRQGRERAEGEFGVERMAGRLREVIE